VPPWSSGGDAGFSARKRGFESRRGFLSRLAVGESATPPASGAGDRWFDSSRPDLVPTTRGGGAAFLASLMSSRRGFESHPRNFSGPNLWGRSSAARALACQAIGRRFESGRPRSWWLWCNGCIRGRDPRGTGSNPVGRPSVADAEHRRAQQAVTLSPCAVVVRLHPSAFAPRWGCSSTRKSASLATRKVSVRLRPSPLRASVVSTASTRPS
jgi:hypothetical protein